MKKILPLAVLAATATLVNAQTVTLNGDEKAYKVISLELEAKTEFRCDNPEFDSFDFDQDGVLDDICTDRRYDPCNKHISLMRVYMLGGCLTAEEAKRRSVERCDGFSPTPTGC